MTEMTAQIKQSGEKTDVELLCHTTHSQINSYIKIYHTNSAVSGRKYNVRPEFMLTEAQTFPSSRIGVSLHLQYSYSF